MKTANFQQYILKFKRPGGTSRGILNTKETFLLTVSEDGKKAIGECGLFRGLSYDDRPGYEEKLEWLCQNINQPYEFLWQELTDWPSIWFGYEQAILNLKYGGNLYFPSEFTAGDANIMINGLIWMGDSGFMKTQIDEKLKAGFTCIKLKIGTDWPSEMAILQDLRRDYPAEELELRVDANGAFSYPEAEKVLQQLHDLSIHSVEQPIKAGQRWEMAQLCASTPTPIALDEELIRVVNAAEKKSLLETIHPQYIILKPSLCGGYSGSDAWIELAEQLGIGWWITSALESNIGLNAIAQYTFTKKNPMPQGLGTGALFSNNFESSLQLHGDRLSFVK